MELKNIAGPDRDVGIVFVDGVQYVPIAHDFFFVPIVGHSLICTELHQARIGGADAFNSVGRLCTLYLGQLNQTIQFSGLLLQVLLLASLVFVNLCDEAQYFTVPMAL